jgi:hypothetical protein
VTNSLDCREREPMKRLLAIIWTAAIICLAMIVPFRDVTLHVGVQPWSTRHKHQVLDAILTSQPGAKAQEAKYMVKLAALDTPPHQVDAAAFAPPALSVSSACELTVEGIPTFPLVGVGPNRPHSEVHHEAKRQVALKYKDFDRWVMINTRETNAAEAEEDLARARTYFPRAKLAVYAAFADWPASADAICVGAPVHPDTPRNVQVALDHAKGRPVIALVWPRNLLEMPKPGACADEAALYELVRQLHAMKGVSLCIYDDGQHWLRMKYPPIIEECNQQGEKDHRQYLAKRLKHQAHVIRAAANGEPRPAEFVGTVPPTPPVNPDPGSPTTRPGAGAPSR